MIGPMAYPRYVTAERLAFKAGSTDSTQSYTHLLAFRTLSESSFTVSPKVCDPTDASQFRELIREVDVVIDAVGGDQIANIGHLILDTTIAEAKKARPQGPPLSYIYCSGGCASQFRTKTYLNVAEGTDACFCCLQAPGCMEMTKPT